MKAHSKCIKCTKPFSYQSRGHKRVVCPDCVKANLVASVRRIRQETKRSEKEESSVSLNADGIAKMGQKEVGKLMGITRQGVAHLERTAFVKVRKHPEAHHLWEVWKEEGCPTVEAADSDAGRQLLEWNMALSEWWGIYDEMFDKGCTSEAGECLDEIAKFFKLLKGALNTNL